MEENNNENIEKKEVKKEGKKKTIKVYQLLLIIILVVVIAFCGLNIYATSIGYDNAIALIKGEKKEDEKDKALTAKEVKIQFTDNIVKEACQKYLDIIGAREGSFEAMLDVLNIKVTDSAFIEGKGYVTNVKFSDYKETLLQYVTEDLFEASFAKGHDDNGYLVYPVGGGTGIKYKVISVEKISENEYKATIDYESEARTEANTLIFKVAEYNGKCVIADERELSEEENTENSNVDNNNQVSNNNVTTLDLTSNFVQGLYNKVVHSDSSEPCYAWQEGISGASFYKDSKTTYSSLNNMIKVLDVLQNAGVPRKITDENEKNNIINNSSMKNAGVYITDIEVYENVQDIANTIFENPNDIKWETYTGLSTQLEYINGNYYAIHGQGGGRGTVEFGYSTMTKAEQDGDYIYIYDKFVWVDETDENNIKVYITSDETNQIGTESIHSEAGNYLLNKYYDSLETYKHTFKKSSDGTYKWISTEIVK